MTKFISAAGLATLWSCIKSTFLTKNDALATYVKKDDIDSIVSQMSTLTAQVAELTERLNALVTTHAIDTQSLTDDVASLQSRVSDLESVCFFDHQLDTLLQQ